MYFSIIIPVYNAQKTLVRCLDSVRRQSFQDFEVILIDDGSADGSLSICEQYSQQDERFRTFHQENAGPSAARNQGLKIAKGRYLCFVDSDDYVSGDYLEKLYEKAEETDADLLFFGCFCVDQTGKITEIHHLFSDDKKDEEAEKPDLLELLSEQDLYGYTWIKCFSRRVVEGIRFPEDMSLFEDEVFTCMAVKKAKKIEIISSPLYYYVLPGETALTRKLHPDYCRLSDRVFHAWTDLFDDDPVRKPFLERKANYFVDRCRYYGFERDVDCKAFFSDLADSDFFRVHTKWTSLDQSIMHGDWNRINAMRRKYRAKQFAAKLFCRKHGK